MIFQTVGRMVGRSDAGSVGCSVGRMVGRSDGRSDGSTVFLTDLVDHQWLTIFKTFSSTEISMHFSFSELNSSRTHRVFCSCAPEAFHKSNGDSHSLWNALVNALVISDLKSRVDPCVSFCRSFCRSSSSRLVAFFVLSSASNSACFFCVFCNRSISAIIEPI